MANPEISLMHIVGIALLVGAFFMPSAVIMFIVAAIGIFFIAEFYVSVYNEFQVRLQVAAQRFANVDLIMQQREDMLKAMLESVKLYDIHEYTALKTTIEARTKLPPNAQINDKIVLSQKLDESLIKLNALVEKYPKLKAVVLHKSVIGTNSISGIEDKLAQYRADYNLAALEYNKERVIIPKSFVAGVCGFEALEYISLGNRVS